MMISFHHVARGSLTVTQSHLEYGKRVGYIDAKAAGQVSDSLTCIYNDLNKVILALRRSSK